MSVLDKPLGNRVIDKPDQPVIKSANVQQADRLRVNPQLGPGDDFKQFFERAVPAGKSNERVRKVFHHCLARVHRGGDVHFCHLRVKKLPGRQHFWNDTRHFAAGCQYRVGDRSHYSDAAATVNQPPSASNNFAPQLIGRVSIRGLDSRVGTAEDAHATKLMQVRSLIHGSRTAL